MLIVFRIALLATLGGCGTFNGLVGHASTAAPAASFADPACGAVARQRGADAAVNGYGDLQARVASDAYAACMANTGLNRKASAAP